MQFLMIARAEGTPIEQVLPFVKPEAGVSNFKLQLPYRSDQVRRILWSRTPVTNTKTLVQT